MLRSGRLISPAMKVTLFQASEEKIAPTIAHEMASTSGPPFRNWCMMLPPAPLADAFCCPGIAPVHMPERAILNHHKACENERGHRQNFGGGKNGADPFAAFYAPAVDGCKQHNNADTYELCRCRREKPADLYKAYFPRSAAGARYPRNLAKATPTAAIVPV